MATINIHIYSNIKESHDYMYVKGNDCNDKLTDTLQFLSVLRMFRASFSLLCWFRCLLVHSHSSHSVIPSRSRQPFFTYGALKQAGSTRRESCIDVFCTVRSVTDLEITACDSKLKMSSFFAN